MLQLIVRMLNNAISGIPNNACSFPGTTTKLYILHLSLCPNFTQQMPNWVILVSVYIFIYNIYNPLLLLTALLLP